MKKSKKIVSVVLATIIVISMLTVLASAETENIAVFSLNLVSETDSEVVVSVNLDSGRMNTIDMALTVSDRLTCTQAVKSTELKAFSDSLEESGTGVAVFVVMAASLKMSCATTESLDQTIPMFIFTFSKSTTDGITIDDIQLEANCCYISDGGINAESEYRIVNNLPITSDNNYKLITADENHNTVVDAVDGYIYGLDAGISEIDEYINVAEGYTAQVVSETGTIRTGTKVNAVKDGVVAETYTVIIFGDVNGDGVYDGMDSTIVACIAEGLLTESQVEPAAWKAADCNHDDIIDEADALMLSNAGLKLQEISQTIGE